MHGFGTENNEDWSLSRFDDPNRLSHTQDSYGLPTAGTAQGSSPWPIPEKQVLPSSPTTVHDDPYVYMTFKVNRRNRLASLVSRSDVQGAKGDDPMLRPDTKPTAIPKSAMRVAPHHYPQTLEGSSRPILTPVTRAKASTREPLSHRRTRSDQPLGIVKRSSAKDAPLVRIDQSPREYVLAGDYANIEKQIRVRFIKIQQNPLKSIAKSLIQRVEPCKQRNHPYTTSFGDHNRAPGQAKIKDIPTTNRSPWWPQGIKWKEPDHLMRQGRTSLLVYIVLMCITNPVQYRACLGYDDSCRCRYCERPHKDWADLMDCTLRDKTLDLRDTPSRRNKEVLMEDKDAKVTARREVLREIFRLAAEVERCEKGELSKTQRLFINKIPPILAKENTRNKRPRLALQSDYDDEDDLDNEDNGTANIYNTSGIDRASHSPSEEADFVSGIQPLHYPQTASYGGVPLSRALSATSMSQGTSSYGLDTRSPQEGLALSTSPHGMEDSPMNFQHHPPMFHPAFSSDPSQLPLPSLMHPSHLLPEPYNSDMGTVYEWRTSAAPAPEAYNKGFVGFAVPSNSSTFVPSDTSSTATPYLAMGQAHPAQPAQSWPDYYGSSNDSGLRYCPEAYPQLNPKQNSMFYPQ